MKTDALTFDAATHTYKLGSEVLPSVTRILRPLYDFSAVPPEVLRRAGEFGTACHKTIELYLADDLNEDELDPALSGCLDAFKAFEIDHPEINMQTAAIEKPGYHRRLKYAGTPDLDCENVLIDIKSRKTNLLTDPLQLIAYEKMTSETSKRQHFVLELYQDTTYNLVEVNETAKKRQQSWSRFRFLLDHYRNTEAIKLWR